MKNNRQLEGMRVAILVDNGFELSELESPREALERAGAQTSIVSPQAGKVRGWQSGQWSDQLNVDVPLGKARADEFDALLLPGGVMSADRVRMSPSAVDFVRSFFDEQKPVAVICHGAWVIVEAGKASGRRITSWSSLKTDLRNAGAEWVDEEVVVDGNLVSSRKPGDIPAFNREILRVFGASLARVSTAKA